MILDHDSGAMTGRVLKGRFAGKKLDALAQDDIVDVYSEASGNDPETANLLTAYLDRRFGGLARACGARGLVGTRDACAAGFGYVAKCGLRGPGAPARRR